MNLKAKNTFEQNINNNHTFAHINKKIHKLKKKVAFNYSHKNPFDFQKELCTFDKEKKYLEKK
jgi:hypothetical protein